MFWKKQVDFIDTLINSNCVCIMLFCVCF